MGDELGGKPAGGRRASDVLATAADLIAGAVSNVRIIRRPGWGVKIMSGTTHLASVADRDVESAPKQSALSALRVAQEVAAHTAEADHAPDRLAEPIRPPQQVWAVFANGRDGVVIETQVGSRAEERRGYVDRKWLGAPPRSRAAGSADS